MANRDYGKNCSTAVKKMADGGRVGEATGFWDRITAGDVDRVGSEAYNRWGEGAKKMDKEIDAASESIKNLPTNTGAPSNDALEAASESFKNLPTKTGSGPSQDMLARGKAEGESGDSKMLPAVKPIANREVRAPKSTGQSLGEGIASGYTNMEDAKIRKSSRAAHAALQKKKKPDATTSLVDQIPKDTSRESDLAARVARIPGYANGGLIGGNRNYGKK